MIDFTELSTVTLTLVLIPKHDKVFAFDSLFLLINLFCYGVYTWTGGF
jgi:hypothetical protein